MIFTLSPDQIKTIKQISFPTIEQVDVKNVILNTSGTDSVLKLTLDVKDSKSLLKIFNNKKAQKLMKMKIFEILNVEMRDDVLSAKTILELEEIIKTYGVYFENLSPTDDFIGDKKEISKHKVDANNCITLQYVKNIILPEEQIKYFSLGVVFYYDLETYVKEERIAPEFIEKSILSSDIFVFNLIENNRAVDDSVNDMRLIKSLFNRQANSNQSNLIMSSRNNFQRGSGAQGELLEDVVYYAQDSGLNFLNSLNSDLELEKDTVKILSEKTKKIKIDTYFSNAYYSRNVNGNLSFLFNIDYQSLIQNNSAYKQQIINSSLKDQFSKQINLTSLKIKRRRIRKVNDTNNSKIYYLNDTVTDITEGADDNEQLLKVTKKSKKGFIKEKAVFYEQDLNSNLRTFEVVDTEVYTFNTGLYQYGVEMVLTDNFNNFISDKLRSSLEDLGNLKSYLKETEDFIKIQKVYKGDEIVSIQTGVYDPTTNSFSRDFVEKTYPEKYKDKVSNSISNFISLLNLFGVKIAVSSSGLDVLRTFTVLLTPTTSNSDTINLFIKTYERYVKQIQRIISNNQNSELKFQHWFTNEYIDASQKIENGYEYILNEDEQGLGAVTVQQLEEIYLENVYKYSRENEINDREINSAKFGYIAPKTIRVKDNILDLNDLIDSPDNLSQYEFIETEMEIKRLNGLGDVNQYVPSKNDPNLPSLRQQNLNLKMAALLSEYSVTIPNLLDEKPKKIEFINNKSDFDAAYNANADASYLVLSMSKLFDLKKSKFKQLQPDSDDFINEKRIIKQNRNYKSEIPMHLSLLLSNQGKVLKSEDNYLNSIDYNSIFNLMYNTIQKIEYLEYNKNDSKLLDLKNEKWSLLTEEKMTEVNRRDKFILCRLSLYKNDSLKVNNFDQIELPIYNKYFILSGLDPKREFRAPRPVDFENFFNSIKQVVEIKVETNIGKPIDVPLIPEKLPDININFPKPKELVNSLSPAATVLARQIINETGINLTPPAAAAMAKNINIPSSINVPKLELPNNAKISIPDIPKFEPAKNIAGAPPYISNMAAKQNNNIAAVTTPTVAQVVSTPKAAPMPSASASSVASPAPKPAASTPKAAPQAQAAPKNTAATVVPGKAGSASKGMAMVKGKLGR